MYSNVREASTLVILVAVVGLLVRLFFSHDIPTVIAFCTSVTSITFLLSNYHSDKMSKFMKQRDQILKEYIEFQISVKEELANQNIRIDELKNYSTSLALSKSFQNQPQTVRKF